MIFAELMSKILEIVPDAQFEEDNYGQIIVYTDLEETPNGQLRKFEPPDDYGDCDCEERGIHGGPDCEIPDDSKRGG